MSTESLFTLGRCDWDVVMLSWRHCRFNNRHPFVATKRARVTASKVLPLLELVWDGKAGGVVFDMPTIDEVGRETGGVRNHGSVSRQCTVLSRVSVPTGIAAGDVDVRCLFLRGVDISIIFALFTLFCVD